MYFLLLLGLILLIIFLFFLTKYVIEKILLFRLVKSDPVFKKLFIYTTENLKIKIKINLFKKFAHALIDYDIFAPILFKIQLGRKFLKPHNGLTSIILSHEIGHCLINLLKFTINQNPFYCLDKQKSCVLLEEIKAWELGLGVLKNLNLKLKEEEEKKFYEISIIFILSYLISDFKYVFKNIQCPFLLEITQSKPFQEFAVNQKETINNFSNYLKDFKSIIPKENIFKIKPSN